jgi:hypothetical protein
VAFLLVLLLARGFHDRGTLPSPPEPDAAARLRVDTVGKPNLGN